MKASLPPSSPTASTKLLGCRLGANFSDCAKKHVAFAPKRGDALLFWSIGPDGTSEDMHASHTGCPVLAGVKWTATKWIHAKPFRPGEMRMVMAGGGKRNRLQPYLRDPGHCSDDSPSCPEWAKRGDCEKVGEGRAVR